MDIPSILKLSRKSRLLIRPLLRASVLGLTLTLVTAALLATAVLFSPEDSVRDQIIRRINLARQSIDVAVYSFTSGDIAQALVEASRRGVRVRVIMDKGQSKSKFAEADYLEDNNIPIQRITGFGERGIMHNKFAVFDQKEVVTGSYNWTENAERYNYENALFSEEKGVIDKYAGEFAKLWQTRLPDGQADRTKEPLAQKEGAVTLKGRMVRSHVNGRSWVFESLDGKKYELTGGDEGLYRNGLLAEVTLIPQPGPSTLRQESEAARVITYKILGGRNR
ncbi:MAG: phospholipase D family protein [Elusimicrobia bacterium]|nr:phospholipase D family protein [Candidatus Obscuribacterium magneticum]